MPLTQQEAARYNAMNQAQRVAFLTDRGVSAELTINPEELEPGFVAVVPNVARLPVGYWITVEGAVRAGQAYLRRMAAESQGVTTIRSARRETLEMLFNEIREAADASRENGYHDAADHVLELLDALESGATAREIMGGVNHG